MGGACSTPHIDTTEPPLEILVLSDGCSSDQALVEFLTQSGWLAASSILQRRLPPRQPHKLPPPIAISTQHSLHHKRSSRSDPAAAGNGTSGSVHPAPHTASTTATTAQANGHTPAAAANPTPTLTPSTSQSPPSSSPNSSTSSIHPATTPPPPPPLLYFLCDTHPISVRFHTCPDYSHTITRRRASTLAKQARPHPAAHSRRPSASAHLGQPVHCSAPLDGAVVFVSTRDCVVAGSVLIAGIRPLLKRRVKEGSGGGKGSVVGGGGGGGVGGEKGRPVVGRVGAEGNMLPFVVVGVDDEKEDETKSNAIDDSTQQQKSAGRITVQPRHSSNGSIKPKEPSPTASPSSSPRSNNPITTTTTATTTPTPSTTTPPTTPPIQPLPPLPQQPQPTTPDDPTTTKKQLAKARASLSEGGGSDSGRSSSERPNTGSVVLARRMGVEEGKGLAVDSGAVGYAAVDLRSGKAMDVALKQLVLAIRKDRQLRGHGHHHAHGT